MCMWLYVSCVPILIKACTQIISHVIQNGVALPPPINISCIHVLLDGRRVTSYTYKYISVFLHYTYNIHMFNFKLGGTSERALLLKLIYESTAFQFCALIYKESWQHICYKHIHPYSSFVRCLIYNFKGLFDVMASNSRPYTVEHDG